MSARTIKPRDFILLDYVARLKDTNQIIDLTIEEVAKKEKTPRSDGIYEPELVVVGEGLVVKGLDEALVGVKEGDSKSIEVPPEKAYGSRDPQKLRILSARDLARKGITPRVGQRVEIDNLPALIRTAGSGRVTADFNLPYAGKTIVFNIKVVKRLLNNEEKILSIIHRRIPAIPKDLFKVFVNRTQVDVEVPPEAATLETFGFAIRGISVDINKYLDQIEKVRFLEVFEYPKEKPASEKKAAEVTKEESKAPEKSQKKAKTAKPKPKASGDAKKRKAPAESAPA